MDGGPVNPACARPAATTPAWAAQPALLLLVQAPSVRYSIDPEAIEPEMPRALVRVVASSPNKWAVAVVAPPRAAERARASVLDGGLPAWEAGGGAVWWWMSGDEPPPAEALDESESAWRWNVGPGGFSLSRRF